MADFKDNRYMTIGIQNEIDPIVQIIMWRMIDEGIKNGQKMDYLQIFKLIPIDVNGKIRQKIIHSQEVPKRKKEVVVKADTTPIIAKIFVIDSEDYVTMLLASEY